MFDIKDPGRKNKQTKETKTTVITKNKNQQPEWWGNPGY